jgi:HAE1 family hydrophobic/amphiphilic exporter-1
VVLEVTPKLQEIPALFDKLYVTSPVTGQQVPLSTFVKVDTTKTSYLSISHQGQFPAVTLSFNLAPGVSLGEAVDAIRRRRRDGRCRRRSPARSRARRRRSRTRCRASPT